MSLLSFIAISLLLLHEVISFVPRTIFRHGHMIRLNALELETLEIPYQQNPGAYKAIITDAIPEKDIIRWYIAKIENGRAFVEVVRRKVDSE
jgi:hypothetical protein